VRHLRAPAVEERATGHQFLLSSERMCEQQGQRVRIASQRILQLPSLCAHTLSTLKALHTYIYTQPHIHTSTRTHTRCLPVRTWRQAWAEPVAPILSMCKGLYAGATAVIPCVKCVISRLPTGNNTCWTIANASPFSLFPRNNSTQVFVYLSTLITQLLDPATTIGPCVNCQCCLN